MTSIIILEKNSAFHSGEVTMHEIMGVQEEMTNEMPAWWGNSLVEPQRYFLNKLQFFVIGSLDRFGRPWASILANETPGAAITAVSSTELVINVAENAGYDPLFANLQHPFPVDARGGSVFAGLGLDYLRRTRVKVAGTVPSSSSATGNKTLLVDFAMGNW